MNEIDQLTRRIVEFRDKRDWSQFHNGKDLATLLNVEAAELLELFLWKKADEVNQEKLKDELADVFYAALLLAHTYNFDPSEIILNKLTKNETKYPVDKSKGSSKKYNEL
jgi:NTP pyrophosphatase (non-canonical NTP hydrolase)